MSGPDDYDSFVLQDRELERSSAGPLTYPASSLSLHSYGSSYLCAVRAGTGAALESCGKKGKIIACFDSACSFKPIAVAACCHRLQCPTCLEQTINRSSDEIEDRLLSMAALWRQEGKDLRQPHHWEFSPDRQDYYTKERIESDGARELWQDFAKALKKAVPTYRVDEHGQKVSDERYQAMSREEKRTTKVLRFDYGVVAIFHGERQKFRYEGQWVGKADLPADVKADELQFEWEWGVHFHVVGYGFFINSAAFNRKTGWVYKKIPERAGEARVIKDTVKYQLSHATTIQKKVLTIHGEEKERQQGQVHHYYGLMANSRGGKEEIVEAVDELCPVCQKAGRESYLHEYHLIVIDGKEEDLPDRRSDLGVHKRHEVIVTWHLNLRRRKARPQRNIDGTEEQAEVTRHARVRDRGS